MAKRLDPWWWLVVGVVGLLLVLVLAEPDPYLDILLFVRDGVVVTMILTGCSFVFIIIVGLLGGLGRISKNRVVYLVASLYVEVVRGIPLLVQLIWWYFAAPVAIQAIGSALNIEFLAQYRANAIFLAIVGLVICYGAYMSEIFRAGILSIHRGQMEAARSLGMSYPQAMRHVVLPQAIRVVLPPLGNDFIAMLKDSALISVLALPDLLQLGRLYVSRTFRAFEGYNTVAVMYLMMTLFLSLMVRVIERRSRLPQ